MRYLKNKLRELFVKRETLVFIILTLIILLCGAFNRDFISFNLCTPGGRAGWTPTCEVLQSLIL